MPLKADQVAGEQATRKLCMNGTETVLLCRSISRSRVNGLVNRRCIMPGAEFIEGALTC